MFKINEIVISNTTPLTTNVMWVKPVSFGLYKLLVYTDSGWTSVTPDEAKQALINASTEYNTLHSIETLTLQQAVDKVPDTDKGLGKMITYFDGTNWQFRQYAGTTLSGWNTVGNWVTVSSSTIDYTGFPLYNITVAVPLTAGQYYTATTARAAVPVNVRKRGLELLYETSAGVWYSERFIGASVADWTLVNNWEAVLSKTYIDTQDALKIDKTSITPDFGTDTEKVISQKGYTDDMKIFLPASVQSDRISTDLGIITNKQLLMDNYKTLIDLYNNISLHYSPELGNKQNNTLLVYKTSKLYDTSLNLNDGIQNTASTQPYLVNNVATNEHNSLWGLGKSLVHNPISFANGVKWSLALVIENNLPIERLYTGTNQGYVDLRNTYCQIGNTTGGNVIITHSLSLIGRTTRHYLVCRGLGEIEYWIDGSLVGKGTLADTSIIFQNLTVSLRKLKSLYIFNKDLAKSEIETLDTFLGTAYPSIEGTAIGSQYWATSNAMISVTGDGTAIPEVQSNDAASNAELITNAADREFSSDTGFWLKNGTNTAIIDGVLRVTNADTVASGISRNLLLTVGKQFQVIITINSISNGGITVQIGTNIFTITSTGTFTINGVCQGDTRLRIYGDTLGQSFEADNVSIKECGWADAQLLYDNAITYGKSVLEATKAAAMLCKYNNSDDNAAVYGYLYNYFARYLFRLFPPKGLRAPVSPDFEQTKTTIGSTDFTVYSKKLITEKSGYFNILGTNETGFSAVGSGVRSSDGTFINLNSFGTIGGGDNSVLHIASNANAIGHVNTRGFALRFLKNAPSGPETQELDTGLFTTDIATAQKELTMSFGHKVVEVKVNSLTNNLTNFKVELRNSAGVFIQNIVQGISVTANTPIDIPIVITQPVLFQDAKLWITATGNTGTNNLGMQVKILTKQIMY